MMNTATKSALSPEHRHLTNETISRIQITLSSRRSSVVVFNTHARLVAVGNGRWDSVAVGAPCIITVKETSAPDSPFKVQLVIAEVESGISLWEEEIGTLSNYVDLQPTFHTFDAADGQNLALQFADATEASSFQDTLKQYIAEKATAEQMQDRRNTKKDKGKKSKKNQDPAKRVSKLDISSPCEFRHLSGISAGAPAEYQHELEDTISRRQKSASMSAISMKKTKQRGKLLSKGMTEDNLFSKPQKNGMTHSNSDSPLHNKLMVKSSSVRVKKRKPIIDHMKIFHDDSSIKSTPSHTSASSLQDHSYWTIGGEFGNGAKNQKQRNSIDQETMLTFKNSAPSQIQQAWRGSNEESCSTKSSNSKTSLHNSSSPSITPLPPLDRHPIWSEGLKPFNARQTPTHLQLNTSPDHDSLASPAGTPSRIVSPPHVVAAANAKKYMHVKPSFNMYDTLLPLGTEEKAKLPPLSAPVSNNRTAEKENQQKTWPNSSESATSNKLPPLSIKENGSNSTPSSVNSPGDLDGLSAELSRVLKDFDSLIAPNSPLEPNFQYMPTLAKETMV